MRREEGDEEKRIRISAFITCTVDPTLAQTPADQASMERCVASSSSSPATIGGARPRALSRYTGLQIWRPCKHLRMITASAMSSDLPWRPSLRFDTDDLLAEAPYLRMNCEDLDWQSQISDLRALASHSVRNNSQSQGSYSLRLRKDDMDGGGGEEGRGQDTWFAAGLALAAATLIQCGLLLESAIAQDAAEKSEAASRVPSWLTPALLAFPVVSYAIFSVYRSQVNPYAKVTDWMFGVVAVVIIANLVLISTIGVRLY